MSTHLRNFLIFILLLGIFIIPSLLEGFIPPIILSVTSKIIKSKGYQLDFHDPIFKFTKGFSFDELSISKIENSNFPEFKITSGKFYLSKFSPLSLGMSFNIYGALINCESKVGIFSKSVLDCSLNDLNLRKIPIFKPIEPTGLVSGLLKSAVINKDAIDNASLDIVINGAAIDPQAILRLAKVPTDLIKISPISDINGSTSILIKQDIFNFNEISLSTSLGSTTGKGLIKSTKEIDFEFKTSLSDTGIKELGPWLPLIFDGKEVNGKNFSFSLSGNTDRARITLK